MVHVIDIETGVTAALGEDISKMRRPVIEGLNNREGPHGWSDYVNSKFSLPLVPLDGVIRGMENPVLANYIIVGGEGTFRVDADLYLGPLTYQEWLSYGEEEHATIAAQATARFRHGYRVETAILYALSWARGFEVDGDIAGGKVVMHGLAAAAFLREAVRGLYGGGLLWPGASTLLPHPLHHILRIRGRLSPFFNIWAVAFEEAACDILAQVGLRRDMDLRLIPWETGGSQVIGIQDVQDVRKPILAWIEKDFLDQEARRTLGARVVMQIHRREYVPYVIAKTGLAFFAEGNVPQPKDNYILDADNEDDEEEKAQKHDTVCHLSSGGNDL